MATALQCTHTDGPGNSFKEVRNSSGVGSEVAPMSTSRLSATLSSCAARTSECVIGPTTNTTRRRPFTTRWMSPAAAAPSAPPLRALRAVRADATPPPVLRALAAAFCAAALSLGGET